MPRLDGQAFYDALVQAGSPMKDRILFITGDTLAPRTRDFLEPRGLPHLDKPFLVEELILAVHGILAARPAERVRARPWLRCQCKRTATSNSKAARKP